MPDCSDIWRKMDLYLASRNEGTRLFGASDSVRELLETLDHDGIRLDEEDLLHPSVTSDPIYKPMPEKTVRLYSRWDQIEV